MRLKFKPSLDLAYSALLWGLEIPPEFDYFLVVYYSTTNIMINVKYDGQNLGRKEIHVGNDKSIILSTYFSELRLPGLV